ncbi:ABC transporter permease [Thermoactinomyces sp. CICC 10523]|uniref:ABC transporter permease n=1 Tax=Thermoactinomyces sp. CICC 10523 TaxID=2767428 RepID=UPI0018DE2F8F|nr:ABC transporter permease [Thermoactinomyces sp. CICC 10523]MBH8599233.1 ABC transporter permease [Thermoactinomyces sp. CICC 10523]
MPKGSLFWFLVRHEYRIGSAIRRGKNEEDQRRRRNQWVIFLPLMMLVWIVLTTYSAMHGKFNMENAWFYTMGLPWAMFPVGAGAIKNEWRNKTEGWWLSLPYSRFKLIAAKFVAAWLKVLIMLAGTYLLAFLYAVYMAFIIGHFHFHFQSVAVFMMIGMAWYSLLLSLSPLLVSLGILRGVLRYTNLRTLHFTMTVLTVFAAILFYYAIGTFFGNSNIYLMFTGLGTFDLSPYFFAAAVIILIAIFSSYFVLRCSASILERKLDI